VAKASPATFEATEKGTYVKTEEAGFAYFITLWRIEVDQDWTIYWLG
jgi:hypothetical protein